MIEKTVLDWLTGGGFTAYMEMPEDFPGGSFVLIEKTGGGRPYPGMGTAVLAIQSYGDSLLDAARLNRAVISRMEDIRQLNSVCRSELNSDYNFPDTEKKRHRYQAVFDILYYEED